MSKSAKKGLGALIQAGNDAEQQVTNSAPIHKNIEKQPDTEPIYETSIQAPERSTENNLTNVLSKRIGTATQMIKIPEDIHKRIKLLSVASGVPISDIISNILASFLVENEKDVDRTLKSMIR